MGVGAGLYMCDVVVKSSRSLSHLLMSSCMSRRCLPVYDEICMRSGSVNLMRSCITRRTMHFYQVYRTVQHFYGRFSSPAIRDMLYCAQRYSCAVEDLLFTRSLRNVVDS